MNKTENSNSENFDDGLTRIAPKGEFKPNKTENSKIETELRRELRDYECLLRFRRLEEKIQILLSFRAIDSKDILSLKREVNKLKKIVKTYEKRN